MCQALALAVDENFKLLMNTGVLQVVSILHEQPLFKYIHVHTHHYCILGMAFDYLWKTVVIPELCGNVILLREGNG